MQKLPTFTIRSAASFEDYADGHVYEAVQGEDYDNRRVFLASLSRFAKKGGYTLVRYVSDKTVQFSLTPQQNAAVDAKQEDPF